MGALSMLMIEAEDAINKLGKKPLENDGYEFKVDSKTWSMDDYVIRAGNEAFVLGVTWLNPPPGFQPSMPNMAKAFKNAGLQVISKLEYDRLKSIEEKYNSLKESSIDVQIQDMKVNYSKSGK